MTKQKLFKSVLSVSLILCISLALFSCGSDSSSDTKSITIAGKDYTEQDILTNLVADVVEDSTDIKVTRKPFLGGTSVVKNAIDSGDIDASVEYTGTALMAILDQDPMSDPNETYDYVKKEYKKQFNIDWMEPLGFNNTYAFTMRKADAEKYGIKTTSDLLKYNGKFKFAADQEFMERKDGYDTVTDLYGLEFKSVKGMDSGLVYTALKNKDVDVMISFTTDGRIPAYDFVILDDNKGFFPPYYSAIICKDETMEKYPELQAAFDKLTGQISEEDMAKMNGAVDIDQKTAANVAHDYLIEKGIIEK